MAVPAVITDLLVAAADNVPKGTDAVTTSTGPDEFFRAHAAIVRRLHAKGADVASAATVDLGAINDGTYVKITGTTTITSFGTIAAGVERTLLFADALTLTHDTAKIIIPGAANITTAAGDVTVVISEGGGLWRVLDYQRAAAISVASDVKNAPAGNIAAVTVQAAINELDTEKQPLDATLTALAGLATGADKLAYSTGADTFAETAFTAFARTILDDADAAAVRTTISAQTLDATLTALAGLNADAGVVEQTGADAFTKRPIGGTASGNVATVNQMTTTKLPTITATVASDALTIGMGAAYFEFRSATLGSGAISTVLSAPADLVVPSGATLGTVNDVKSRLMVGVMNNAGTAELFVINASQGNFTDEGGLITTAVLDAASDSSGTPYSATARTDLPFRWLGYIESKQATAGTWATAPSLIQPFGGRATERQPVFFRAYQDTKQAIAATTRTKVLFQKEGNDDTNNFADSVFTLPQAGVYFFSCSVGVAQLNDGAKALLELKINGSIFARLNDFNIGALADVGICGSTLYKGNIGDTVEVSLYLSTAEDTIIGADITYFTGARII